MHSYLRAIGFSNINNRTELNKLINLVIDKASNRKTVQINHQNSLTEMSMKLDRILVLHFVESMITTMFSIWIIIFLI